MRLWSIHPKYLDTIGIVALWREALLAKHVLEGKTKGYKNHPQLIRFKKAQNSSFAINQYLAEIYKEAEKRNFCFDKKKINSKFKAIKITVTSGQIDYEFQHLMKKLKKRNPEIYNRFRRETNVQVHPLFRKIDGDIESWEILQNKFR